MASGSLYVLLALAIIVGVLWGAAATMEWTRRKTARSEALWTDADFEWLDSQTGES